MRLRIILIAAAFAAPGVVAAQAGDVPAPARACVPGETVVLPPELAGWNARAPLAAAVRKAGLRAAVLGPGIAVDAALRPTSETRYLVAPGKPGDPQSHGGMFSFAVERAGSYRIVLGAGAWIDVIAGKQALASSAHGHGPDCSGIRKMVDFALTPGIYTLQISGNADPVLPLMIARLR